MRARVRKLEARVFPHGVFDVIRQVLLFAAAYWAYRYVRGAVDGKAAESFQNARELISLERGLNLFIEPTVQAWANGQEWLIDSASWMYINSHFSITLGSLVYIYLFHNSSFYFVRNMFMVAMSLALVGYVLYPTAPPRFLPEWGFTDSVSDFTGIPQDDVKVNALFNPFAAVPSMHVCFALMIAVPIARLAKHRSTRVVWTIYPLVVIFVIVATGNHFITDAILGALTAAVAAAAARRMARARPAAWTFAPARQPTVAT